MNFSKSYLKYLLGIGLLIVLIVGINLFSNDKSDQTTSLPDKVDFNYHIKPILSQNCYVCHGPDSSSREAGLRLDQFEVATAELEDGGSAIVPGNPAKSLLLERIRSKDPDLQMPPPSAKKVLSAHESALIEKWIDQGAEWKEHWSFIPPEKPSIPFWKSNPSEIIDHLVDKQIDYYQLEKSPKASKNALIRRVAYLMTGLPPSPEDVKAFLADDDKDAFEKVVDKYIASPHFGERWARHWMDLMRYGENMGHEFDFSITGAHEYRDYLIRAFNQDVPYDVFVKEHLAGDMMGTPRYNPDKDFNESVLGTGYFFLGEGKHSPVNIKQEEAIKIDNMIDVTSKSFLGLTVACAKCHDHKFDPIPTTDYYAMYGMIESGRLIPQPGRRGRDYASKLEELNKLEGEIRNFLSKDMAIAAVNDLGPNDLAGNPSDWFQLTQFIDAYNPNDEKEEKFDYKVIGDFRDGSWEGWYSSGIAFGDTPLNGKPIFDSKSNSLEKIQYGVASSRKFGVGLQGVLHSPNFIIEHDSIAVRAAGFNGTIRIIVDNFQVIQWPLYGSLEKVVNDSSMQTYTFDLALVQGRKAYIEFVPGRWGKGMPHSYQINPEDWIEVEYALSFSGELPKMDKETIQLDQDDFQNRKEAIVNWNQQKASREQIDLLNEWFTSLEATGQNEELNKLLAEYHEVSESLYDSTFVIGMAEGDAVFSPVFIRGSVAQPSEEKVPRQFLHALQDVAPQITQTGSGRLAWAKAVVSQDNPLASRVIVNRLWHHVFGRGIVASVDNFGLQGELPTHPELLDYLALQIQKEGWSMKRILKHMLMSETFQRGTQALASNKEKDPSNLYLHHFPIRRLEGEAIRDGILAVSGRLDSTMYGKSFALHLTDFMTGRGRPKESGPLDGFGRRSVYMQIRRNFLPPMMLVFDMPIPFSTFGRRLTTNVPAQSLTLMNDPFVLQQAELWAKNVLAMDYSSDTERIQALYMKAYSRNATTEEVQNGLEFLKLQAATYAEQELGDQEDLKLWADYCHTLFNLKEFIHLL